MLLFIGHMVRWWIRNRNDIHVQIIIVQNKIWDRLIWCVSAFFFLFVIWHIFFVFVPIIAVHHQLWLLSYGLMAVNSVGTESTKLRVILYSIFYEDIFHAYYLMIYLSFPLWIYLKKPFISLFIEQIAWIVTIYEQNHMVTHT